MKFPVAALLFTGAFINIDLCFSILYGLPREPPRIQIDPIRGTDIEIRQPPFPIIEMRPSFQNHFRGFHDEVNQEGRNNLHAPIYQTSPRRLVPGYRQRLMDDLEHAARVQYPHHAESSRHRENSEQPSSSRNTQNDRQRIMEELEHAARVQYPDHAESSRHRENSEQPTRNTQNDHQRIMEELEHAASVGNPNRAESSRHKENSEQPSDNSKSPTNKNFEQSEHSNHPEKEKKYKEKA